MPKFHIVIHDAQLAHDREIARNVEANVRVHGESHRRKIERMMAARYVTGLRETGTIHDTAETECPVLIPDITVGISNQTINPSFVSLPFLTYIQASTRIAQRASCTSGTVGVRAIWVALHAATAPSEPSSGAGGAYAFA